MNYFSYYFLCVAMLLWLIKSSDFYISSCTINLIILVDDVQPKLKTMNDIDKIQSGINKNTVDKISLS
jgi:hypothetical protein